MKFKKLEVSGFKSFADRLEVKFGGGVTAIVGPNGCGKSNVADSIRWVLGEQSAKLLRGSSMQDVIFGGTESRKSLSFCEVALFFDNTEKLFPSIEYDEVVISRKLYRSGESEYYLNKTQVRLKDITDLLRDSGMGREGYSIIGQGRIDELLSAKPEDRRAIFEEAAGISKFKARKIDAERKLGRTRDNLIRIGDILEEKSKMLEPLTKQSEAARKWLELRDKLKNYEINTYIHQYDTASIAKNEINNRLNGVLEDISLKQKLSDQTTAQYNDAMSSLVGLDKNIDSLREELLTLTVGMEKTAGEVKLYNERLSYLNSQNERLSTENKNINEDYELTIEYIENGTKALTAQQDELCELKKSAEKFNDEYLAIVETLTSGEGEVESNHRLVLEAMDKLGDIKSNMSRLLAEKEARSSMITDLQNRISVLNEKISIEREDSAEIKKEIAKFASVKSELSESLDKLFAVNNECLSQIAQYASELDKVSAKFYMSKSKHKMLVEMQEAYEGFAYSVKNLLNDAKTKKELSEKIEGVVASLITVKPGFETAIEMALGNAVQNIVTKNEEDAKFLIEYLKQFKYGRVTFLPLTTISPRVLENGYKQFMTEKGCFGIAANLLSFDVKYDRIVQGLLGNTVIVDNMDSAIALARKARYGFKIVTLEGDIINPHGSITGGSKKSELTNIFGYDKEIKFLSDELSELTFKIDELTKMREQSVSTQQKASQEIRVSSDKLHSVELELATKREIFTKLESSLNSENTDRDKLNEEIAVHTARINEIISDINSVGELENLITLNKQNASDSGQEYQQQFDSLRKERDAVHELMTNTRMKVAAFENEINSTTNEIKRLQTTVSSFLAKIELNNEQISANDVLIAQIDEELKTMTIGSQEGDSDKVKFIRNKLSNLDEYKQSVQTNLAELDNKRTELVGELQKLSERKSREEMQLLKVDTDIEQMQQRILEEYELDYTDCLPFKEVDFDINKGMTETNRIKRQMAALGNVNLASIEQSKELFESYHALDIQRDDLVKAEDDLLKIIKELANEMIGRFTTEFEKIRVNFVKIFKELFDGGTADLLLLENENLLDAGIEIVAQPPSKKLQSISLLSGGERALTAIAILFAILRLKPMPFCVLDEIEAALDDANAGRFAKYLRRFSEETQFIVITHRKPTMELADNLYGVTMEEKGVSKIVSVKLSEAVAAAESMQP